jgi:hypothetical protein
MEAFEHELGDVNPLVNIAHIYNSAHFRAPRLGYDAKGTNHNRYCVSLGDVTGSHHLTDIRVDKLGVLAYRFQIRQVSKWGGGGALFHVRGKPKQIQDKT